MAGTSSQPDPGESRLACKCVSFALSAAQIILLMTVMGGASALFKPMQLPTGLDGATTAALLCMPNKDLTSSYYVLMAVFCLGLAATFVLTCLTVMEGKLDRDALVGGFIVSGFAAFFLAILAFGTAVRYKGVLPKDDKWLVFSTLILTELYLIHAFAFYGLSTSKPRIVTRVEDDDCCWSLATMAIGVLKGIVMLLLLHEMSCQVFKSASDPLESSSGDIGRAAASNNTDCCMTDDAPHWWFMFPTWLGCALSLGTTFLTWFTVCNHDAIDNSMYALSARFLANNFLAWGLLCAPGYTAWRSYMAGADPEVYKYIPRMMVSVAVLAFIERGFVLHLGAANKARSVQRLAQQQQTARACQSQPKPAVLGNTTACHAKRTGTTSQAQAVTAPHSSTVAQQQAREIAKATAAAIKTGTSTVSQAGTPPATKDHSLCAIADPLLLTLHNMLVDENTYQAITTLLATIHKHGVFTTTAGPSNTNAAGSTSSSGVATGNTCAATPTLTLNPTPTPTLNPTPTLSPTHINTPSMAVSNTTDQGPSGIVSGTDTLNTFAASSRTTTVPPPSPSTTCTVQDDTWSEVDITVS